MAVRCQLEDDRLRQSQVADSLAGRRVPDGHIRFGYVAGQTPARVAGHMIADQRPVPGQFPRPAWVAIAPKPDVGRTLFVFSVLLVFSYNERFAVRGELQRYALIVSVEFPVSAKTHSLAMTGLISRNQPHLMNSEANGAIQERLAVRTKQKLNKPRSAGKQDAGEFLARGDIPQANGPSRGGCGN